MAKILIWHQNLHNHNLELISVGDKDDVEIDHNEHVFEEIDDRPIALRKGKRTCTEHSIHNFLSYGKYLMLTVHFLALLMKYRYQDQFMRP